MGDTHASMRPVGGIGTTALGRVQMRSPDDDGGHEDIIVERRWPTSVAARAWCERCVDRARPGSTILEIQVFAEQWQHARSWETTKNRPVAATLQLGVVTGPGELRWSEPRSLTARAGSRHLI